MKIDLQFSGTSIRNRVQEFIEGRFLAGSGLDKVKPDDSLLEKGIIDSTGILEVIDFLEETFQIRIMDEELVPDNLDSINKVVGFIKRKITPN
ncbi:MAG: acyl carrier protein [Deltaproteobacteria bacterium]|nr:acyl carrier protein [Deltaproteobacteria bacterium]